MQLLVPPDLERKHEIQLVVAMVSALGRMDMNTFVLLVAVAVLLGVGYIVVVTCEYLFKLYREQAFGGRPYQQYFRILLGLGLCLALVLGTCIAMPELRRDALTLSAYAFCAFSIASVLFDWYAQRQVTTEVPALRRLTAEEVLDWQEQVNAAHERGLLVKGA